jgi:hypothetical protein
MRSRPVSTRPLLLEWKARNVLRSVWTETDLRGPVLSVLRNEASDPFRSSLSAGPTGTEPTISPTSTTKATRIQGHRLCNCRSDFGDPWNSQRAIELWHVGRWELFLCPMGIGATCLFGFYSRHSFLRNRCGQGKRCRHSGPNTWISRGLIFYPAGIDLYHLGALPLPPRGTLSTSGY